MKKEEEDDEEEEEDDSELSRPSFVYSSLFAFLLAGDAVMIASFTSFTHSPRQMMVQIIMMMIIHPPTQAYALVSVRRDEKMRRQSHPRISDINCKPI